MATPSRAPRGSFAPHRRLERMRQILARHSRGVSLYELADALGVSPRTTRRYLQELRAHSDVEAVPGSGGGKVLWRMRVGSGPRNVGLRRVQAYALLATRRLFEPLRGSSLYEEVDLALQRLLSVAQRAGRGPNASPLGDRLETRLLYLPEALTSYEDRIEELDDLFQAVADLHPLLLSYRQVPRHRAQRLLLHPLALVLFQDRVHCIGYLPEGNCVRVLELDQMRDTECLADQRFEVPDGFCVDDYVQGEFGLWAVSPEAGHPHKVVIDFNRSGADAIRRRKVHPSQMLAHIAGGGLRLTVAVGRLDPVVHWVLQWGDQARVVHPPQLQRRVRAALEAALAVQPPASTLSNGD